MGRSSGLQYVVQELLYLDVAQTAALVMLLQLLCRNTRPELGKVLGRGERFQIYEHRVALDLPGSLPRRWPGSVNIDMTFFFTSALGVGQEYGVAQRLAHLGHAVCAGQAHACLVVGQQYLRLDQRFAVYRIEPARFPLHCSSMGI